MSSHSLPGHCLIENSFNRRFGVLPGQVWIKKPRLVSGRPPGDAILQWCLVGRGGSARYPKSVNEEASYGFASQEASQKDVAAQVPQAAQGESP